MTSVEESITQNRVRVLNEFIVKLSRAVYAHSLGQLEDKELDFLERAYRREATIGLVRWGVDEGPAQIMIDDQAMCINKETGEVTPF